jgi:hypothetical protein
MPTLLLLLIMIMVADLEQDNTAFVEQMMLLKLNAPRLTVLEEVLTIILKPFFVSVGMVECFALDGWLAMKAILLRPITALRPLPV